MRQPPPGLSPQLDPNPPQNHIRELVAKLREQSIPVIREVPTQVAPDPKPPKWQQARSVLIRGEE